MSDTKILRSPMADANIDERKAKMRHNRCFHTVRGRRELGHVLMITLLEDDKKILTNKDRDLLRLD